jgi:hypothetical protein
LPRIAFTSHLRDVGPHSPTNLGGATLATLFDALDADFPRLKDYVLDDQGRLRKHIAIFIDGALTDRETALTQSLAPSSDVYVFQALSGG